MSIPSFSGRTEAELLIRMVRLPASQGNAERVAEILQGEIDWSALLAHARRHGLLPLLYRRVSAQENWPIPGQVVEQLRECYLKNSKRNLLRTGILFRILQRLQREEILAVPYKGPTLALMAYGDLGLREFEDLDLLIQRQDLGRAKEILLGEGFRVAHKLTAAQERRFLRNKGQLPLSLDEQHLIELHQELFHPSYGFKLDHNSLQGRLESVCVAGHPVLTYCPEDTLVILAAHGAKHYWHSLGWICDLAGLIQTQPSLDWNAMISTAEAAGGRRIFSLGVFLARELLAAPVPPEVISAIEEEAICRALAAHISAWLFSARGPTATEKAWFLFRSRDRAQDGVRDFLSRLLTLPKTGH